MEFALIVSSPPVKSTAARNHLLRKESIILHHSPAILFPSLVHPQFAGKCARIGRSRLLSTYATSDAVASVVTILRDGGSAAVVMVGGYSLVRAFDSLTKRNVIEQVVERNLLSRGITKRTCLIRYSTRLGFAEDLLRVIIRRYSLGLSRRSPSAV